MNKQAAEVTRDDKIKADTDLTTARRNMEKGQKLDERFANMKTMITEREEKRASSKITLAQSEKSYKAADDEYKSEALKCKKINDANANVGKAYNKLKSQMKEWSEKNPWLKQDPSKDVADNVDDDGTDIDGALAANLGGTVDESLGEIGSDVGETNDPTEMPPWARRSFVELIQEEYGTDVRKFINVNEQSR